MGAVGLCKGARRQPPGSCCSEPFLGWPRSSSRLWICKPRDLHRIPPRPEPLGSSVSGRGGGWCCAIPTTRRFGRGQRVGQQNDVWGSDPRTWFSPCSSLLGWSLPCGRSQGGGNPRTRHNSALWKRAQLAEPLAGHGGGPIPYPGTWRLQRGPWTVPEPPNCSRTCRMDAAGAPRKQTLSHHAVPTAAALASWCPCQGQPPWRSPCWKPEKFRRCPHRLPGQQGGAAVSPTPAARPGWQPANYSRPLRLALCLGSNEIPAPAMCW